MSKHRCSQRGTDHPPQHSNACRADIAWWTEFIPSWNGVSFLCPPYSSGIWGYGAWLKASWFQLAPLGQPSRELELAKELV